MIVIEDKELETMVLAGGSCIAVPIEIWVPENGESQITVYSCFEYIASMFDRLFQHDPLKADALKWLDGKLYATVKEFGYLHGEEDIHHLCEYAIGDLSRLCKSENSADVNIINSLSEIGDVDASLVADIDIDEPAAVIIENGKLVSIACTNDVCFDDGSVEIYVETHSEYRRRGYGVAVVKALADSYLQKDTVVRYKCAKNNLASAALAEKCGFVKLGERYSYVCYSIDE